MHDPKMNIRTDWTPVPATLWNVAGPRELCRKLLATGWLHHGWRSAQLANQCPTSTENRK